MLLSPGSVMHISVYLTRNLLTTFDAMVVSTLLLAPEQSQKALRRELHQMETARRYSDRFGWGDVCGIRAAALQNLLKQIPLSLDELFARPHKTDSTAAGYCPVCFTEYRWGFNICRDCEVPLKAY